MSEMFDLGGLDAKDEVDLTIRHPKTQVPTSWIWTFYGPGHPKTVELANKALRETLRRQTAQRQAQINGKKWKDDDDRTPDQIKAENIASIVARTKSFTPVKLNDETISFSAEAATALLSDRKKGWLLDQIVDFLKEEENFIQPSATS